MSYKEKYKITEEDKKIIELRALGYQDKEISEELNLTMTAFRYRYCKLLAKIGAVNAPNLIYLAFSMGILGGKSGKRTKNSFDGRG